MDFNIFLQFLLALGIGAIIGLEREIIHQKYKVNDFAGVRNFTLIALFGAILSYISITLLNSLVLFLAGFIPFTLLVIAAYIISAQQTKRINITTAITSIITFVLGAMTTIDHDNNLRITAVILAVLVAGLLAVREQLHSFAKKTKMIELFAAIKFALITLVVLPFLPNKNYTLLDIPLINSFLQNFPTIIPTINQLNIFNPYMIWLLVVFISGLSFVGYVLIKTIGVNKGIGITSLLGGLVSSTAVTLTLAQKSKKSNIIKPFIFGIILANSIMLVRVLIEVMVINPLLLPFIIIPVGAMSLVGFLSAFTIFFSKKHKKVKEKIDVKSPLAIFPAIKFAIFFIFILIFSRLLSIIFGSQGIYVVSILSGFADVDAITITLSSLSATKVIESQIAAVGITLAAASNILAKGVITHIFGAKKVAMLIYSIFALVLITGLLALFVI